MPRKASSPNRPGETVAHGSRIGPAGRANPCVVLNGPKVAALRGTMTLTELAEKFGVGIDTLRRAERGEPIRRRSWHDLAACYRVAPESLLAFDVSDREWPGPTDEALRDSIPPGSADRVLGKKEISDLARRCGLFRETRRNPHLIYTTGDISYWSEQSAATRRASSLWAELRARGHLLETADADRDGRVYPTQGDLSHAVRPLVLALLGRVDAVWRRG